MVPFCVDSRPAGHKIHALPPELVPKPRPKSSVSLARRVTYEPAGHAPHCAAPSTPLKVPIGHGRHWSAVTAPGSALYVPTGHELQVPMSHEKHSST